MPTMHIIVLFICSFFLKVMVQPREIFAVTKWVSRKNPTNPEGFTPIFFYNHPKPLQLKPYLHTCHAWILAHAVNTFIPVPLTAFV